MTEGRARRRPRTRLGALAAALALAAGPAAAGDYPGFSLEEPAGPDWQQVQRNAASIVWMRRLPDPAGSFAAAVLTGPAPRRFADADAFAAYVRRSKGHNPEPSRFAVALEAFEQVAAPAPGCVRYRTVMTEEGGGGRPTLVLTVEGLACLHPANPGRYFDAQYSSRGPEGFEVAAPALAEGEAFLAGFRFGPAPADGEWALGSGAVTRTERERT